jgi:CRP-like cAMP-binding protein
LIQKRITCVQVLALIRIKVFGQWTSWAGAIRNRFARPATGICCHIWLPGGFEGRVEHVRHRISRAGLPMSNATDALMQRLRTHYLFADLDDVQHARLLSHLHVRPFSAGQSLFDHGDPARVFFVLHSGAVKLYRVSDDGHEKIMRLIAPGQSFAEAVMFMEKPCYPVHAQGLHNGVLIAIEAAAYLEVMEASFATCRTVFARMTERIQAHWDEIESLTLQNSRYRVVHYLIGLASTHDVGETTGTLPVSKSLIASQLAITPETLSRILRSLNEADLIEMQGNRLYIPSLAALRETMMP